MTRLNRLHGRRITRVVLRWSTCHTCKKPTSTDFNQTTKSRNGKYFGQVTDDRVDHFWALVKIATAFLGRRYPLDGGGFHAYACGSVSQHCHCLERDYRDAQEQGQPNAEVLSI
jgi:hypothetical protein